MMSTGPLLVAVAIAGCNSAEIDPMENQPRQQPFRENAFFADDRGMRPLPLGTVPRERSLSPPAERDGMVGGAYVTSIPIPLDRELLLSGRRRFEITCAACHGVLGDGQSAVASKMAQKPPPPLYEFARRDPPGRLYAILTHGYGLMPGYGEYIPVAERWATVAYLQALRLSQEAQVSELPPAEREHLEQLTASTGAP
jgi:mono/diheme cytochrome c family protein